MARNVDSSSHVNLSRGDHPSETSWSGSCLAQLAVMTTVLLAHASVELYGSDLQLVETVAGCIDAGADVVVVLPGDGPLAGRMRDVGARVEILDVPVLRKAHLTPRGLVALGARMLRALGPTARLIRRVRPDSMMVNTLTIPTWLAAARLAGVPPVCHVHEAEADAPWVVRVGLAAPLLLAQDIIVNSATARDVVVSAVPVLRRRTRVVYNGVPGPTVDDLGTRDLGPARDGAAPEGSAALFPGADGDAGAAPGPTHVVLVGRLSPRKGTDVALEAVALLRRAGRDVRLTLCGSVFAGYEWFEDQLRGRADEADLAGAVELVGYVDPWEWFARGDAGGAVRERRGPGDARRAARGREPHARARGDRARQGDGAARAARRRCRPRRGRRGAGRRPGASVGARGGWSTGRGGKVRGAAVPGADRAAPGGSVSRRPDGAGEGAGGLKR
jgi:glycosyltransferase involved in cell wall biosynthesis